MRRITLRIALFQLGSDEEVIVQEGIKLVEKLLATETSDSVPLPGIHAMLVLWHLSEAWKTWVDKSAPSADAIVTAIKCVLRRWPLGEVLARNTSSEELEAFENLVRERCCTGTACIGARFYRRSLSPPPTAESFRPSAAFHPL